MGIFGDDGIISLRKSVAIFEFLGITGGLLALRRVTRSYSVMLPAGIILLLWMWPRHKLFDLSISVMAVYVAVLLIEKPTLPRHFAAGAFVGFAAFFGRNHGLYNFTAFLLVILFVWFKLSKSKLPTRLAAWGAGIVLGYMPMLMMIAFVPGFGGAFWDSLVFIVRYGSTNIFLPIPWPWTIPYGHYGTIDAIRLAIVGALFVVLPAFVFSSLLYLSTRKENTLRNNHLLIAATFVGLPYMHYAFSRADIGHLAHSIFPVLLGFLAVTFKIPTDAKHIRSGVVAFLLLLTCSPKTGQFRR